MSLLMAPEQVLYWGVAIAAILIYLPYGLVAYGRVKSGFDPNAPRRFLTNFPLMPKERLGRTRMPLKVLRCLPQR
jgi:uncharacterized MAPEG superfamily protein